MNPMDNKNHEAMNTIIMAIKKRKEYATRIDEGHMIQVQSIKNIIESTNIERDVYNVSLSINMSFFIGNGAT